MLHMRLTRPEGTGYVEAHGVASGHSLSKGVKVSRCGSQ